MKKPINSYRRVMDLMKLTPREAELLGMLRSGKTKKEIAEITGLKPTAVESTLYRAREKERAA